MNRTLKLIPKYTAEYSIMPFTEKPAYKDDDIVMYKESWCIEKNEIQTNSYYASVVLFVNKYAVPKRRKRSTGRSMKVIIQDNGMSEVPASGDTTSEYQEV